MLQLTSKGHRVAIAGQVIDAATQQPIAGAQVAIAAAPAEFQQRLRLQALPHGDRWAVMLERGDRTLTTPDGCFYFTNILVEGDYTLVASVPVAGPSAPPPKMVYRSPATTLQVKAGNPPPFAKLPISLPTPLAETANNSSADGSEPSDGGSTPT